MRLNFTITALLLLIGIGFWGGLSVSYANLTGEQACPQLAGLAICYVVAIAYGSMLASLFLRQPAFHYAMFLTAWGITFLVALLGSGLELSQGGVCPTTSFLLPLCYVSLAMCLVIMGIYLVARPRKGNKLPLIQL
jgi:hypothetical protein